MSKKKLKSLEEARDASEEAISQDLTEKKNLEDEKEGSKNIPIESDAMLDKLRQENAAMRQQIGYLENLISQVSEMNTEEKVDDVTADEVPTIDLSDFPAEPELQREKISDFRQKVAEYTKERIRKELEPALADAKRLRNENDRLNVLSALAGVPELEGIHAMTDELENIIKKNVFLQGDNIPPEDKYIAAYVLSKGANAIMNPKTAPSVDELMVFYNENKDFRDQVEKLRINELRADEIPAMSATGSAASAALNIPEKPKTFEEATERAKKLFGIY